MEHFYIIANSEKPESVTLRDKIVGYLNRRGKTCSYQENAQPSENHAYSFTDPARVPEDIDAVLVLGGDGTVIQAARDLARRDVPFLGINVGTLGYHTEVEASEYGQALDTLIRGEYDLEKRMMLCGEVFTEEGKTYAGKALNDIVISRQGVLRVVNFQIFVNGRYLNSYNADGMIISTPTGSTGYNLSAGGPIVEPGAEMLLITPICPHTLNARSIVLSGHDQVEIVIGPGRKMEKDRAVATFDGDTEIGLVSGERVKIRRSIHATKLIKLNDQSFLEVLSRKLM